MKLATFSTSLTDKVPRFGTKKLVFQNHFELSCRRGFIGVDPLVVVVPFVVAPACATVPAGPSCSWHWPPLVPEIRQSPAARRGSCRTFRKLRRSENEFGYSTWSF